MRMRSDARSAYSLAVCRVARLKSAVCAHVLRLHPASCDDVDRRESMRGGAVPPTARAHSLPRHSLSAARQRATYLLSGA